MPNVYRCKNCGKFSTNIPNDCYECGASNTYELYKKFPDTPSRSRHSQGTQSYTGLWIVIAVTVMVLTYNMGIWTLYTAAIFLLSPYLLRWILKQGIEESRKKQLLAYVEEEEKKRVKNEGLYNNLLNKLKSSTDYDLVINFSKRYINTRLRETDISELNNLLNYKGYEFSPQFLRSIVEDLIEQEKYLVFKDKLLKENLSNEEDILRFFVNMYGENWRTYENYLYLFLKEENIDQYVDELHDKILEVFNFIKLEQYERKLRSAALSEDVSIENLDNLDGHAFEDFLQRLFVNMGYSVKNVRGSHDQGADLILSKFDEKTVVQAKRYSSTVTNSAVQEVVASIKHYEAETGWVVTTNEFTKSAKELARSNGIKLIDRDELRKLIKDFL